MDRHTRNEAEKRSLTTKPTLFPGKIFAEKWSKTSIFCMKAGKKAVSLPDEGFQTVEWCLKRV
jgi:hypothetical protein